MVAGWWQVIAHHRPDGLWFARLLLHHIEALVAVEPTQTLDLFETAVLRAISRLGPAATLQELDRILHLGPKMLTAVLQDLRRHGLVTATVANFQLSTEAGARLRAGNFEELNEKRLSFHFLINDDPGIPPEYLDVRSAICQPLHSIPDWTFDPAILQLCITQSEEWKAKRGFPRTVRRLIQFPRDSVDRHEGPADPVRDWSKVIYDRPECVCCAIVRIDEQPKLIAYAVDNNDGRLHVEQPVFELKQDVAVLFNDLDTCATMEAWQQALTDWCLEHAIAFEDAHAMIVEVRGADLQVAGPPESLKRLWERLAKLPPSETWLMAGKGRLLRLAKLRPRN
jgi:hypothetical protein